MNEIPQNITKNCLRRLTAVDLTPLQVYHLFLRPPLLSGALLEKLTFYTKIKCWAPQISWFLGAFGLPVIFLRAQPCMYLYWSDWEGHAMTLSVPGHGYQVKTGHNIEQLQIQHHKYMYIVIPVHFGFALLCCDWFKKARANLSTKLLEVKPKLTVICLHAFSQTCNLHQVLICPLCCLLLWL